MDIRIYQIFLSCFMIAVEFNCVIGMPKVSCKKPAELQNGNFMINSRENTVKYYCNDGYSIIGEESLSCERKRWSGNPPICAASGCGYLELLRHGTVIYNHNMKVATFECDKGLTLNGVEMIICEESGWSDKMPSCEGRTQIKPKSKHEQNLYESDYTCITKEKKVTPPREPFTRKSTEWAMAGGKPRLYTVYRCDWGYVPVGSQQNMYCKNGTWIGLRQQCKYVGKVTHKEKSTDLKKDRSHEDWLRFADYSCFTSGKDVKPPRIDNSVSQFKVAILDGMPHMYVKYICKEGFKIRGEKQFMYCVEKQWWGHIPMCVKN